MADTPLLHLSPSASASTPPPSRLQRRRPSSLLITPSSWNVAIPLLSPLASSPPAIDFSSGEIVQQPSRGSLGNTNGSNRSQEKLVFKKWQHPALPFCGDSSSFNPKFFVPV